MLTQEKAQCVDVNLCRFSLSGDLDNEPGWKLQFYDIFFLKTLWQMYFSHVSNNPKKSRKGNMLLKILSENNYWGNS